MPAPFAAYMRVYEPLAAFDRDQQRRWRDYLKAGRAIPTAEGPARQRDAVRDALGAGATRLPELPDEAYALKDEDTVLICPWNLRLRVAEAALSAREDVPPALADALVPPALAAAAEKVVDARKGAASDDDDPLRVHEHSSTWAVPIRWFVFVEGKERELSTASGRRHLRYRVPISRARRRAAEALKVLRSSLGDTPVTRAVTDGARWLEQFHSRSVVELDYGGLVALLDDEQLDSDNSPELAAEGLAALSRGDARSAGEAYEKLVERWRRLQMMERCN